MNAELVFDGNAFHVVAGAERTVVIDEELRHHEQRNALHAGRRIGQARQHQMDDVLGAIVFAVGDENLLPEEAIAAVGLGFGARAHGAEVGAGLRLGQVHGAAPGAGDQLRQVLLLEFGGGGEQQGVGGAEAQQRQQREGEVCRLPHFLQRRGDDLGKILSAKFLRPGDAGPAGVAVGGIGFLPALGRGDDIVLKMATFAVSAVIERGEHSRRQICRLRRESRT